MDASPPRGRNGCAKCGTTFSLFVHRHSCHMCCQVFCWKCASKKAPIPHLNERRPVRLCDICFINVCVRNEWWREVDGLPTHTLKEFLTAHGADTFYGMQRGDLIDKVKATVGSRPRAATSAEAPPRHPSPSSPPSSSSSSSTSTSGRPRHPSPSSPSSSSSSSSSTSSSGRPPHRPPHAHASSSSRASFSSSSSSSSSSSAQFSPENLFNFISDAFGRQQAPQEEEEEQQQYQHQRQHPPPQHSNPRTQEPSQPDRPGNARPSPPPPNGYGPPPAHTSPQSAAAGAGRPTASAAGGGGYDFTPKRELTPEESEYVHSLPIRQLKAILADQKCGDSGCIEKSDLVERVLLCMGSRGWKGKPLYRPKPEHVPDQGRPSTVVDEKPAPPAEGGEPDLCRICYDRELNCVFLECGHLCSCMECGRQMKDCPICRRPILRVVEIFKS